MARGDAVGGVPATTADHRLALAREILARLRRALPPNVELALASDQPSERPTAARIVVRGPDAVGRLLWPPSADALGEAYLRGDIDIEGDIWTAEDAGRLFDLGRLVRELPRLARLGLELRRGVAPGPELRRRARLAGRRHSRARCGAGHAPPRCRLWLGLARHLRGGAVRGRGDRGHPQRGAGVVGCRGDRPAGTRWPRTRGGSRLPRSRWARPVRRGRVGRDVRARRARAARRVLRRGATRAPARELFLNHGIATTTTSRGLRPGWLRFGDGGFVGRYVFSDGDLVSVEDATGFARRAGFELIDVQRLRPHYALTLKAWVERLEASSDRARELAGEEIYRTWRLYMAAARRGFEDGSLDVAQLLLARPGTGGPADLPLRPWWQA